MKNLGSFVFILLLSSCMIKNGHYIDDNPVEEIAEAVIKVETGINIDFTPSSPEN